MATEVWCELVCGACSEATRGTWSFDSRVPRKELKDEASARGWVFYKNAAFCSPSCLDRYKEVSSDDNG